MVKQEVIVIDPFNRSVKYKEVDTSSADAINSLIGSRKAIVGLWFDIAEHQLIIDEDGLDVPFSHQKYFSIIGVDDIIFSGKAIVVRQSRHAPLKPLLPIDLVEAVVRWEDLSEEDVDAYVDAVWSA